MDRVSVIGSGGMPGRRSVKDVPFVELIGGRVQGVISSGSDVTRVYVAYLEAGTGDYYCVTNNNRPCGGLRGSPCKHIAEMVDEAILQFGAPRVVAYLGMGTDPGTIEKSERDLHEPPRVREERVAGHSVQSISRLSPLLRAAVEAGHRSRNGLVCLMNGLATLPSGVEEALGLVGDFDEALLHGFARLSDEQRTRLDSLAGIFAGTPLGSAVIEAAAAVERSEFLAGSFLTLAAARVALLGAAHDALVAQAREALERPAVSIEEAAPTSPGRSASALSSTQHWLTELAIVGLKHLEESSVLPFDATLEQLQGEPELTGLAALLTGFSRELFRSIPAARKEVPAFRWGDLWSGAMVRTQQLPPSPTFRPAEGVLTPLGLDVQSHEHFVCAVLYAVLDDGEARTVRVPFSGYKVDVIAGAEVWDLFEPIAEPVLEALATGKSLRINAAELRSDGDLILRMPPEVGGKSDPFDVADRLTSLPSPPALLRHPVHIAEVVRLPGDHGLPLALERLAAGSELTAGAVAAAPELIGLLRFDRGGWRVQPLCIRDKKSSQMSGESLAGLRRKLKNRSLDILKERAGRLLRAKS